MNWPGSHLVQKSQGDPSTLGAGFPKGLFQGSELRVTCQDCSDGSSAKTLAISHFFFSVSFFFSFMATLMAYRNSQARGQIRAAAARLHHSDNSARSEPRL